MFMSLNEPHKSSMTASNDAFFRRLKVIPFKFSFKDASDYDPSNNSMHKLRDDSVKSRVTSTAFRHGFLRLLLDTYGSMYNVGEDHPDYDPYFVPDCVRQRTTEQQIESDPFAIVCKGELVAAVNSALVLADVASKICDLMQTEHRCFKSVADVKRRLKSKYRVKRDTVPHRGKIDCIQDVAFKSTVEQEGSAKRGISFVGYDKEEGGGPAPKKSRLF